MHLTADAVFLTIGSLSCGEKPDRRGEASNGSRQLGRSQDADRMCSRLTDRAASKFFYPNGLCFSAKEQLFNHTSSARMGLICTQPNKANSSRRRRGRVQLLFLVTEKCRNLSSQPFILSCQIRQVDLSMMINDMMNRGGTVWNPELEAMPHPVNANFISMVLIQPQSIDSK